MAAQRYLDELDDQSLTGQIDDALDDVGTDVSSVVAAAVGRRHLAEQGDW